MTTREEERVAGNGLAAASAERRRAVSMDVFGPLLRLFRVWRQRARERNELSEISVRDCADMGILKSLAAGEARRWPWQKPNPEWREIETARHGVPSTAPSPPQPAVAAERATALSLAAAALTILLWALTPITTRIATTELDGLTVGLFRTVGASLLAAPLLLVFRLPLPRSREGWVLLVSSAVFSFIGFPLLFSLGTARTSASHSALIMATMGITTGLIGSAVGRSAPRPLWLVGAAVAFAGDAALITERMGLLSTGLPASALGDSLVLGACLAASAGFVAGARLTDEIGAWAVTFWALALSGIGLLPWAAIEASRVEWKALGPAVWVGLIHLVLGANLIARVSWFWALARGGIARVSVLQLSQPVISVVFAVFLLSERLTVPATLAAIAILGGVLIARRGEARKARIGALRPTGGGVPGRTPDRGYEDISDTTNSPSAARRRLSK